MSGCSPQGGPPRSMLCPVHVAKENPRLLVVLLLIGLLHVALELITIIKLASLPVAASMVHSTRDGPSRDGIPR